MPEVIALPVPVMVRRFACPFCKRSRSAKKATAEHIGRCWENPAVRSCKTCAHLVDVQGGGGTCFPGRSCNCNDGYRYCGAGIDFEGEGFGPDFPRTGCPLWAAKTETEEG